MVASNSRCSPSSGIQNGAQPQLPAALDWLACAAQKAPFRFMCHYVPRAVVHSLISQLLAIYLLWNMLYILKESWQFFSTLSVPVQIPTGYMHLHMCVFSQFLFSIVLILPCVWWNVFNSILKSHFALDSCILSNWNYSFVVLLYYLFGIVRRKGNYNSLFLWKRCCVTGKGYSLHLSHCVGLGAWSYCHFSYKLLL